MGSCWTWQADWGPNASSTLLYRRASSLTTICSASQPIASEETEFLVVISERAHGGLRAQGGNFPGIKCLIQFG